MSHSTTLWLFYVLLILPDNNKWLWLGGIRYTCILSCTASDVFLADMTVITFFSTLILMFGVIKQVHVFLMKCPWGSIMGQMGVSVRNSPAWSDALDDDDSHTISHLVCEAHWSINKGSTLLPNNTEIKDCYIHLQQSTKEWNLPRRPTQFFTALLFFL